MATGSAAPSTTYNLATGIKLDMEDLIYLMSPTDTPFTGGGSGMSDDITLPTGPATEKKVEWLDEVLLLPKSTVQTNQDNSQTTLIVASGDKFNFQVGSIVRIGDEFQRVTSYGSGDTLNVSRAWSGAAAAHSSGAVVTGTGTVLPEGSVPPTAKFNDRTARNNITQIFGPTAVSTSRTDQVVQKYGVPNEFFHQGANRTKEMMVDFEQAVIYGAKVDDTANAQRQMGGMLSFITTNNDSSTTTLTEAKYLDHLQSLWDAGGSPEFSAMGSTQKRNVSAFTSAGTVQVQRADGTRGTDVEVFVSDFGTISLKLHRQMRKPDIITARRDQFRICVLSPLTFQMLGKTGDFDQGMLVMEKTLKVYKERFAGRFSTLT